MKWCVWGVRVGCGGEGGGEGGAAQRCIEVSLPKKIPPSFSLCLPPPFSPGPDDEYVLALEFLRRPEVVRVHNPPAEALHPLEARYVWGAEVTGAGYDVVEGLGYLVLGGVVLAF